MNILLFLAKGFETMEASVFVDVMGWAYHHIILTTDCSVGCVFSFEHSCGGRKDERST